MKNEELIAKLFSKMAEYDAGDAMRIQHFTKVHNFSRMIGIQEGLDEDTLFTLEAAAVVHDIGIKLSLIKYNSSAGPYQEKEGPPEAEKMLTELGFDQKVIDRVCYLVGHHHTYTCIEGIDYRILVEADFLVNLYENSSKYEAAQTAYDKYFRTEAGREICRNMFLVK